MFIATISMTAGDGTNQILPTENVIHKQDGVVFRYKKRRNKEICGKMGGLRKYSIKRCGPNLERNESTCSPSYMDSSI